MARPYGSKNKKKTVSRKKRGRSSMKTDDETEVKDEKGAGSGETCKDCSHEDKLHYGSADRWCNSINCQCQALKL